MSLRNPKDHLWLAVDVPTLEDAKRLVGPIAHLVPNCKIGLELITAAGPAAAVAALKSLGVNVWYDGKFCDIPNTVAGATRAAAELGVAMLDVHAGSGIDAMRSVVANKGQAKVLAITVLTSQTDAGLKQLGIAAPAIDLVQHMTAAALEAGADGIVCSPQELPTLAADPRFTKLMKITPGVRPSWAAANDQQRIMTPAGAIRAGATAVVIGRPITQPPRQIGSPADAINRIYDEIAAAFD
jgi:orotidine-5'-phosphate decarboxylase